MASKKNKIIISVRDNLLEASTHIQHEVDITTEAMIKAMIKELESWLKNLK